MAYEKLEPDQNVLNLNGVDKRGNTPVGSAMDHNELELDMEFWDMMVENMILKGFPESLAMEYHSKLKDSIEGDQKFAKKMEIRMDRIQQMMNETGVKDQLIAGVESGEISSEVDEYFPSVKPSAKNDDWRVMYPTRDKSFNIDRENMINAVPGMADVVRKENKKIINGKS